MQHAVVVGGGILGVATARVLTLRYPSLDVTVVEKEPALARHQTGHNSGVVHAGIYYAPGSLKAALCRRGMTMLREFCADRDVPYHEVGKLVVAATADEVAALRELERRSQVNAVPGLRWLPAAAISEREPHVVGAAALHSPRTAITDFVAVTHAFADDVRAGGGRFLLGTTVQGLRHVGDRVRVQLGGQHDDLLADLVVLCAGLQSDHVARLAGDDADPAVIPFRGEYLDLVPQRRDLVRGLVYPVPDPDYPFLGVHVTRRVDGRVDIGPNAVLALAREGYRRSDVRLTDVREVLGDTGFRALARQHWRMGAREMVGSLSRAAFVRRAQRYVPSLRTRDVVPGTTGVRAQAVARDGSLVDDFCIRHLGRVVAVRNAPSPAATSSMAIAEHLVDRLDEQVRPTTASAARVVRRGR